MAVSLADVTSRWMSYIDHVLGPKEQLHAGSEWTRHAGCSSRVAVENSEIGAAESPPHDDPHPINTPVDDSAAVPGFDIEE
jgi:hypothetical protein